MSEPFEVPFFHEVEAVEHGKRKPLHFKVRDSVPVRLAMLEEDEFPLVARYVERTPRDDEPADVVEIRTDGERFFHLHTRSEWKENPATRRQEEVRIAVSHEDLEQNLILGRGRESRHQSASPFSSVQGFVRDEREIRTLADLRPVLSRDRDAVAASIVAAARDTVVFDSMLYESCGEPVWKLGDRGWGDRGRSVRAGLSDRRDRAASTWRADELPIWEELTGETPDYVFGSIEVLRPDLLRFAVEERGLVEAARSIVESHHGIEKASKLDMGLYADLRDAMPVMPARDVEASAFGDGFLVAVDAILERGVSTVVPDYFHRDLAIARDRLSLAEQRAMAPDAPDEGAAFAP